MEKITKEIKTRYCAKRKAEAVLMLDKKSLSYVANKFMVSEETIKRWRVLFKRGGIKALVNKSSRPLTEHPNSHKQNEIDLIESVLKKHADYGLYYLYQTLRRNYNYRRSYSGLYKLLKRLNLLKRKVQSFKKHDKPYNTPMEIGHKWQFDVKHVRKEHLIGKALENHINKIEKLYQFTAIDEASRQRFVYAYNEISSHSAQDFLKRAVIYFKGVPKIIQTDNGSEFTYVVLTHKKPLFTKTCELLTIAHKLIAPYTPQHNGKVERSHRRDEERFYKRNTFNSFLDFQTKLKAWNDESNELPMRPLKDKTPLETRAEKEKLGLNVYRRLKDTAKALLIKSLIVHNYN